MRHEHPVTRLDFGDFRAGPFVHETFRIGRVDRDGCIAPVELGEDLVESRVTEVSAVVVALHHDTVDVQGVDGVVDLLERAVHGGQRQRGEQPESTRVR